MRLFVAIDLDDEARRAIGGLIARMRTKAADTLSSRIAWVAPDRIHLTLHFFADVDAETAFRIAESVAAPIDRQAFRIAFAGIGTFSSRGVAKVIWLGVRDGAEPLRALHSTIGERLKVLGCELEDRPFSPHLTLARLKPASGPGPNRRSNRGPMQRVLDPILAVGGERDVGLCVVDRVTLYESRLGREGATHIAMAAGLLRAADPSSQ